MSNRSDDPVEAKGLGSTYAAFQLSKALTTSETNPDPEVRARAEERTARWLGVLEHMVSGAASYGSRTPLAQVPAWVTLEVATGGFATGRLLAGGELTGYERELAASLPGIRPGYERLDLNLWCLSDAGLEHLRQRLQCGDYRIDLPEEAALPTVAWLLGRHRVEEARSLIEAIAPFFDRLRFFPPPAQGASIASAEVNVFSAGDVARRLAALPAQPRLAEQRYAVEVRLPLYDETVALFLDTYSDGWPCRQYPSGWSASARGLCLRIDAARRAPALARDPTKNRVEELFALLAVCADEPMALTGRQVGRVRRIVDDFVQAHGPPGGDRLGDYRQRQRRDVAAPAHHLIAKAVSARLAAYPAAEGIADFTALCVPISSAEAEGVALESGIALPTAIRRRLERCRRGTIAELIESGIITSADTVARVLPALTAEIRSAGFADATLRRLYAATYRAFRRRRSLLLVNLESQVRLAELPWVAIIENDRAADAAAVASAREALVESAAVTLLAFPHAIFPNKLLQEYRALAQAAQLNLPFVDEVAADIFMGQLSAKFADAGRRAARSIAGTVYADYYAIDTDALAALPDPRKAGSKPSFWRRDASRGDALSMLAAARAGAPLGAWRAAVNGTILEQAQILTTHNLALLFDDLGLKAWLQPNLEAMAQRSFEWICRRQQMRIVDWRARLTMIKNTAYAWRQMIFYLSALDSSRRSNAVAAIEAHFSEQQASFRAKFEPAMLGLRLAMKGRRLNQRQPGPDGARVFIGWTTGEHWLLSKN